MTETEPNLETPSHTPDALPDGWQTATIEELCERVTSGGTPSRTNPAFFENGAVGWVKTQELRDCYIYDAEEHITNEAIKSSSAKILPKHTVLMAMYGATVGQLGILDQPMTCNQACCALIVNIKRSHYRFVYYTLLQDRNRIKSLANGGAQQNVSGQIIKQLAYVVPPLVEQRAIAHVLGAFDDKIELNRRMNETLEAMARALFESWFVRFDPVRAKASGDTPAGMNADTAALFPSAFVDSALGAIPEGWTVASIREKAKNIQYGYTQSASLVEIGPAFVRITDIQGGVIDWAKVPFCSVTKDERERYSLREGDVLVARTGASTGENIYIVAPPSAVFASYLVRFQFETLPTARFVGEYMRTKRYFDFVDSAVGGSAQPNASAQVLSSPTVAFPPDGISTAYYQLVSRWDSMKARGQRESRTLAALRDALLPKLVSGTVRLPADMVARFADAGNPVREPAEK